MRQTLTAILLAGAAVAVVPAYAQTASTFDEMCKDILAAEAPPTPAPAPGGTTPVSTPTPTPGVPGSPGGPSGTPETPGTPGTGTPGTPGAPGTGTPTPTPTPAPTPTPGPPAAGDSVPYVTNPNTKAARVTSRVVNGRKVTYYVGTYTSGYKPQDLKTVKKYKTPTAGTIKTVGGQKVTVRSSAVDVSGLSTQIVNIIDEIHITAALLGLPTPVITSAKDGSHSAGSLHGRGHALDLRCNNVSSTQCVKWVMTMKQAFGPGYDVMFEDWGDGNSHIHIEYDGKS